MAIRNYAITEERYTSKQFFDLVALFDPNYQYELWDGAIIKMPPASMLPSTITARITGLLIFYLMENDIGFLTSAEGAYILSKNHTFAPDVGYISYERQPENIERGFVPQAPDLAVEVVSPSDNTKDVQQKAEIYLAHGTRLVWIIYPVAQKVEIYHINSDGKIQIEEKVITDSLSGKDVLPDLTIAINDIFAMKKSSSD